MIKLTKQSIANFFSTLALSIALCIFISVFIATPNQVEGVSMLPNFESGDIIITSKLNKWFASTEVGKFLNLDYKRGDVIVFQKPLKEDLIKRIIGLPGEKISIKSGKVYVNDMELKESYLPYNVITKGGSFLSDNGEPKLIPLDAYIVLGDNREQSHDSRYLDIGFVKKEWIKGKVIFRYWPLQKIGTIYTGNYN